MSLGINDEFLHIRTYLLGRVIRRRDRIAMSRATDALAPNGTEPLPGISRGASAVQSLPIAPENEDLIGAERFDALR